MSTQFRKSNHNSHSSKKLNPALKSKIDTLTELFPDWTSDDLIDIVQEYDDLETIIDKITSGAVTRWDEVKKPAKKEKYEKRSNNTHMSLNNICQIQKMILHIRVLIIAILLLLQSITVVTIILKPEIRRRYKHHELIQPGNMLISTRGSTYHPSLFQTLHRGQQLFL